MKKENYLFLLFILMGGIFTSCSNNGDEVGFGTLEIINNSGGSIYIQLNQNGKVSFQEDLPPGIAQSFKLAVGSVRIYAEDTLKDNYIDFVHIVPEGHQTYNVISNKTLVIRNNQEQAKYFYYQRSIPGQDMPDGEWIQYRIENDAVSIGSGIELPIFLTFGYRYWASTTPDEETLPGKNLFRFQVNADLEVINL